MYEWAQEAYCFALSKLKEAMEEPQQETLAFLDAMHSQLTEVTGTTDHPPPDTSSGKLFVLGNRFRQYYKNKKKKGSYLQLKM